MTTVLLPITASSSVAEFDLLTVINGDDDMRDMPVFVWSPAT